MTQPRAATYQFEPGTGWKLFDVTPIVRVEAKAGKKGHGVLLRFLSEDFAERGADWSGYQFVSREGTGEWARRHPVLLVVEASESERPRRAVAEQARAESPDAGDSRPTAAKADRTSKPAQSDAMDVRLARLAPGRSCGRPSCPRTAW